MELKRNTIGEGRNEDPQTTKHTILQLVVYGAYEEWFTMRYLRSTTNQ